MQIDKLRWEFHGRPQAARVLKHGQADWMGEDTDAHKRQYS